VNGGGHKVVLRTTNGPVSVGVTGSTQRRRARGGSEPVVIERQLEAR
jgi:hypothetical protein